MYSQIVCLYYTLPPRSSSTAFPSTSLGASRGNSSSSSSRRSLIRFCVLVKEARGLPLRKGTATQKLFVKVKVAGASKRTVLVEAVGAGWGGVLGGGGGVRGWL